MRQRMPASRRFFPGAAVVSLHTEGWERDIYSSSSNERKRKIEKNMKEKNYEENEYNKKKNDKKEYKMKE